MPVYKSIALTAKEILMGAECGLARHRSSKKRQKKAGIPYTLETFQKGNKWWKNIIGAQAEIAFAEMIGQKWEPTVDTFKNKVDVPPHWEVRWARTPELIIRPTDPYGRRYALLTGDAGKFIFWGWTHRSAAEILGDWSSPRKDRPADCWRVNHTLLSGDISHETLESPI